MPRIQQNALGAPMGTAPVMPTQGGNPYAGQGMQALGRGLTAVADVTQEYALRLREARQRRDIARFKVDSARAFMDLAEQYRGTRISRRHRSAGKRTPWHGVTNSCRASRILRPAKRPALSSMGWVSGSKRNSVTTCLNGRRPIPWPDLKGTWTFT